MTAWYEFEELVGRRWHRWAAAAGSYPRHPRAAVALDELQGVLAVYFRALGGGSGLALNAGTAAASSHRLGWRQRLGFEQEPMPQARVDDEQLLLPERVDCFPERRDNRDLYFCLGALLAVMQPPASPADDPLQRDLAWLVQVRRASRRLCRLYPGLRPRYRRLALALFRMRPERRLPPVEQAVEQVIRRLLGATGGAGDLADRMWQCVDSGVGVQAFQAPRQYRPPLPVPLWGRVVSTGVGQGRPDERHEQPGGDAAGSGDATQRRAERRRLDQTERDDPLLLNPFEKMLSWSEMVNVNRQVEDDDEQSARKAADQLEELTLSRHRKTAATRLSLELELAPQPARATCLAAPQVYPEWHFRRRAWLPAQCAVYTDIADAAGAAGDWQPDRKTRRRIRLVRRQFEALRPRRELLRRQFDGDELDLDALVRARADRAAGASGSEQVYQQRREQARDLAAAILVDVSLSTDAWVGDRRVIDIEKEALLVLAHGIQACGDRHAIYTFTSRRRARVLVNRVKAFDEQVDGRVAARIAALKPGLYTRMGAALRHVTGELARCGNRHRLLLVLSDGKPNDTDYYEGRYAIEDTRMAVREARRRGLAVFGVAIDDRARQYLPVIFGRGGYAIVARSAGLANTLPLIYRHLIGC